MPLKYYDLLERDVEKLSNYVHNNVEFFNEHTVRKLDYNVDILLEEIDAVKFKNNVVAIDRFGNNIYWNQISTGGMTILNVFYNPDKIFSLCEAGPNTWKTIFSIRDGGVVSGYPVLPDELECDILYRNKRFYTAGDLLSYIKDVED